MAPAQPVADRRAGGHLHLVLVGDGAFQMTGWELGNCRRYGFDPIVVVFNNARWEMLRAFQPEARFNDLDDWSFAALAPSLMSRFRSSHHCAATSFANFGIEGH